MRIHHLDGGGTRPFGGRLVDGRPGLFRRGDTVNHCVLIELETRLVLIDTGYGEQALLRPNEWVGRQVVRRTNPVLDKPIVRQVETLGFSRADVRDIVVTHLDLDHAGGLVDFPHATVHVHQAELAAFTETYGWRERFRYRPVQLAHGPTWSVYAECDSSKDWFGFQSVEQVRGLSSELLIVPLAGHTRGHIGVAVRTARGWFLHAGDAYTHHGQMADPPRMPLLGRVFEQTMDTHRRQRAENQHRLRDLVREPDTPVNVFSAHCATEFARLCNAQSDGDA
ncbi:MBL fold metallo-hydrolase [Nocardia sp. CNY236]|uniref:MBL fold metallo-hydrolase n=1 Tax=Nocardia sp. CNY236 TaxID=1169152 RepID=UPI00048D5542|nr:MBL fold metallo-hydrolase [Nocardia sp. CNY236]